MELLKIIVENVVVIAILAVLLDILLPDSKMRPYIKLVMGLMIIIAVLQPLWEMMDMSEELAFEQLTGQDTSEDNWEDITASGSQLAEQNEQILLSNMRAGLEQQIKSLIGIGTDYQVARVEVQLDLEEEGQSADINAVTVWLGDAEGTSEKNIKKQTDDIETVTVDKIDIENNMSHDDLPDSSGKDDQASDNADNNSYDNSSENTENHRDSTINLQTKKVTEIISSYYNLEESNIFVKSID